MLTTYLKSYFFPSPHASPKYPALGVMLLRKNHSCLLEVSFAALETVEKNLKMWNNCTQKPHNL